MLSVIQQPIWLGDVGAAGLSANDALGETAASQTRSEDVEGSQAGHVSL